MFININKIKFKDFPNMCRTCMNIYELKPIKNNFILEVLHNITDINFKEENELPQNICDTCIKKINEIQAFAFQCIEINVALNKCYTEYKMNNIEGIDKNQPDLNIKTIKDELEITNENNTTCIKAEMHNSSDQIHFEEIENLSFDQNLILINEAAVINQPPDLEPNDENLEKWFKKSTNINYSYMASTNNDISDTGSVSSNASMNLNIVEMENSPEKLNEPETNQEKCQLCNKFFSKKYIKQHLKKYHSTKLCTYCNLEFNNFELFLIHKTVHSPINTSSKKCETCNKTFKSRSALTHHKKSHKLGKFLICGICTKVFYKWRLYAQHLKKNHLDIDFECSICLKIFKSVGGLKAHEKTHKRRDNL